ncbi:flavodoxin family protein [Salidesulfovibrio brasiliensis]
MPDILAISATPRRGGNSDRVAAAMVEAAREQGVSAELVKLRDYQFSSCIGCEACRKDKACTGLKDGLQLVYPLFEQAKGLILVTPVHTYNVTAWMKAFIDRLYCYYDFEDTMPRAWSSRLAGQGRKAVLACVGEQAEEKDLGFAMPAMRLPLESHDYEILGELSVLKVFAAGKVRERPDVMQEAQRLGVMLARAVRPE